MTTSKREGKLNPFYGKKHSEDTIQKMREAKLGNKYWVGKKHTEEAKEKMRLSKLGKPNLFMKGKPKSEEHKKALSETRIKLYAEGKLIPHFKDKTFSEEHKNNISKSRKELFAQDKIKTWNKDLAGEEYLKHFREGNIWAKGKKLHYPIWNKNKTHLEDSRILSGEKIHTFNNWSANKPYTKEFNKLFKKAIKERDGCCMLCNIGFEDLKSLKREVHIHHIDYNKYNSFPQNCVSLCNSCHSKTNFNKPHWIKFFQSILKERHNYQYDEIGNVLIDINDTNINLFGLRRGDDDDDF